MIDGHPVYQFNVKAKVFTTNEKHYVRANAFMLVNTGNDPVEVLGITFKGGASRYFGDANPFSIYVQELLITFEGTGNNPSFEVTEVQVNHPDLAHFIELGKYE